MLSQNDPAGMKNNSNKHNSGIRKEELSVKSKIKPAIVGAQIPKVAP
jgi:hypothetical protein